jgi:hypothetical protein
MTLCLRIRAATAGLLVAFAAAANLIFGGESHRWPSKASNHGIAVTFDDFLDHGAEYLIRDLDQA